MSVALDIIFAGGGTTACVVAGRLTAADPSLKVLIVESGQHSRDVPQHVQPCRFVEHLTPTSTTLSFHVAKPSPHTNGRTVVVSCGRGIGGGSTVNFMLYMRGAASDYDDWNALGNEGWSFAELFPLITKFETFAPISGRQTHGYSGPIQISTAGADPGVGKHFLHVGAMYDPGRPQVDDINDFKTANAYAPVCKYVDPVTGKRSDAASKYLYPHMDNPNLKIIVGARVKRVIIENGRAVGIEYAMEGIGGEVVSVKATKLVVISAGAFGSPSILERSGIGAPSVLEKYNIPVMVDLPGVGENYQDHVGICPAYYASDEIDTLDDVWSDPQAVAAQLPEWERSGKGKIARVGVEAVAKVRLTAAQLASTSPALRLRWQTFFQNNPDKPLALIIPFSGFPSDPTRAAVFGRKHFAVASIIVRKHGISELYLVNVPTFKLYPEATGSIHVTSSENSSSPLEFEPGYCSKPGDVAQFILLYKMTREHARRMPVYRGEVADCHPKFSLGSPAACRETEDPVLMDAPDIVYSAADDEAIEIFIRDKVRTTWHSLGTCAMKPRDQGGVVDARLNVYGVEGLKVSDLSICPTNVGNNTYSNALLIGEKAAAIIAEELGVTLK